MYILQNAIQIFHNGNAVILNSRTDGIPEVYAHGNKRIYINGGRKRFDGIYKHKDLLIKDLRLTYDSTQEELINRLLWADSRRSEFPHFVWVFAKNLPIPKLQRILEESCNSIHPYIYKALNTIYQNKLSNSSC